MAQNLGVPWGMVFINKKELLFTEREGNLKILHLGTGKIQSVSGLPEVFASGQGGLLDVALHPRFKDNKIIYFSFSQKKQKRGYTTVLARGRLQGTRLRDVRDSFFSETSYFGFSDTLDPAYFFIKAFCFSLWETEVKRKKPKT